MMSSFFDTGEADGGLSHFSLAPAARPTLCSYGLWSLCRVCVHVSNLSEFILSAALKPSCACQ